MKEITVTEPAFVTRFSCSGSACRDHCCKGWKITLDKTTVKKVPYQQGCNHQRDCQK